jgi:glycosyltransferase involved in cell wall biosynthesis
VVHAHFWMSGQACLLARAPGVREPPVALTFHALGTVKRRALGKLDPSPAPRIGIERTLVQQLDAVVATCREEVGELLDMGAPAGRLRVVPCGVDLQQFSPAGPRLKPWRPGTRRLLSLGRLVERKGVDTAIAALALLPDAELVVAGGPSREALDDDPDVARLRRTAVRERVADRVHFTGRVGQDEAAALMRAADLVLAVPWYEPFGIVPLEAMACGTPVVATAVGGMLDTVLDGRTGAHVPPRRPVELAKVTARLLDDADGRHELGRAAREQVRVSYGWPRVAAATEAVYAGLVADTGGTPRREASLARTPTHGELT